MKSKILELEGGSFLKGQLPLGCTLCRKGAKLFLLITGKCNENCYYCSLDASRKGHNIILANERPIKTFSSLMIEAVNMNALGAAITGGDPLLCVDNTSDYIMKMKKEFGKKFHVHLYTSGRYATEENLEKLFKAGLTEIRFHPQNKEQEKAIEKALTFPWVVGAEIPVIPKKKDEIITFLEYLNSLDYVKFCNLNELEATETNLERLKNNGLRLKSVDESAIEGSETLALDIIKTVDVRYTLHYCSATTKDAVQFRNRLFRTAKIVRKPYEEIQDGMLVKAVIELPDVLIGEEILEVLIQDYEVDVDLISLKDKSTIETAWYIADTLKDVLFTQFRIKDIFITYEYPTFGNTLIAKAPLKVLNEQKKGIDDDIDETEDLKDNR